MISWPLAYMGVPWAWWYYIWTVVSIGSNITFGIAPIVMWIISFVTNERPCGFSNRAIQRLTVDCKPSIIYQFIVSCVLWMLQLTMDMIFIEPFIYDWYE